MFVKSTIQEFNDTTVYIRQAKDIGQFNRLKRGVYYVKAAGGIGNQLSNFISSLLYAEILGVPFICYCPRFA